MPRKSTRYSPAPLHIDVRHVRTGKRFHWMAAVGYTARYDINQLAAIRRLLEVLNCDPTLAEHYENHESHLTLVVLVKPKGYVEPKDLVPVFVTEGEGA